MIPETCEKCPHVFPNSDNGGWKECRDSETKDINNDGGYEFVPGKNCVYKIMEEKK